MSSSFGRWYKETQAGRGRGGETGRERRKYSYPVKWATLWKNWGSICQENSWKTLEEHILQSYPTWESRLLGYFTSNFLSVGWGLLPEMPGLPPVQMDRALGQALRPRASRAGSGVLGCLHQGEKGCWDMDWTCFTYFIFLISWTPSTLIRVRAPKGQGFRVWGSVFIWHVEYTQYTFVE